MSSLCALSLISFRILLLTCLSECLVSAIIPVPAGFGLPSLGDNRRTSFPVLVSEPSFPDPCPKGTFQCSNYPILSNIASPWPRPPQNPTKWKCISSEQVCDQVKDCPNRDDESVHLCSCPNEPDYFRCKGLKAKCIPPTWQCDNVQDCVHGDDEDVAKCLPQLHHNCLGADNETVYSGVRKTVPLAWKCDGELDCSKGDDEKFCPIPYPRANCSQGQYNCLESSTCIDAGLICNQIPDCPQLDDERDCKSAPEPENGLPNAIPPNTPFWRRSARQRPVFTAV